MSKRAAYIYFIRGQGGQVTSPGIDHMASQLPGKFPQNLVHVSVWNWDQSQAIVDDMRKHAAEDALHIVVGFSLGANASTWVANVLPHEQFDLLVAMDPSVWTTVEPLHKNVKRALLFKNDNVLNVVGLANLKVAPGFDPKNLMIVHTFDPHLLVDTDPKFQGRIYLEIMAVLMTA